MAEQNSQSVSSAASVDLDPTADRSIEPDTIVARATPPGEGAIAIVRLSGAQSGGLLEKCFRIAKTKETDGGDSHLPTPRMMTLGEVINPKTNESLDTALAVWFPGPHSYTGEDLVEFHLHGSPALVARVVELFVEMGARIAEPGEFTRRAFLNGRMDLTQAEAVADLVRARSDRAQQLARRQLAGELSRRLQQIRQSLLEVAAELEARLDFPDEELGEADLARLARKTHDAEQEISHLIAGGRRGRLYRDGVRVVLVGRPNAGKSSLFNALLGRERALVTPHPGTTRDFIEATLDLRGLPLTLVDTAGLRDSTDEIERLGIERTRGEVESADLVLWVADINFPPSEEHQLLYNSLKHTAVALALNKIDLAARPDPAPFARRFSDLPRVMISARTRQGLDELEDFLESQLLGENSAAGEESPLVSNMRHLSELGLAQKSLRAALETFRAGHSPEFIMVDLRDALAALGRLLGLEVEEALLDEIFSRFCLGK